MTDYVSFPPGDFIQLGKTSDQTITASTTTKITYESQLGIKGDKFTADLANNEIDINCSVDAFVIIQGGLLRSVTRGDQKLHVFVDSGGGASSADESRVYVSDTAVRNSAVCFELSLIAGDILSVYLEEEDGNDVTMYQTGTAETSEDASILVMEKV